MLNNNRPNQGPPDLEEIWQQFNQKLNNLLGGKGEPSGPHHHGASTFKGMGIILILLLGMWMATGFFLVDERERGIVLHFGKFSTLADPGLHWRWPYPFESNEIVNLSQVRTVEIGYRGNIKTKIAKESLMVTDDENIIDIQFAVQYILKDPAAYLFNNRFNEEDAKDAVMQAAETAIREMVGKSKMDFVLYEGREQVAASAKSLIQAVLDRYQSGILVSQVTMQNAQPPEQVQRAFEDAIKAKQDKERKKNEGQAYANDVIPKARGKASRLLQEADGYKQRVVATAKGDASRFNQVLVEYSKAPGVTRDRLYLDMMQQVLSNTSKIIIDQKSSTPLLYLPLDKIMQMTETATSSNEGINSNKKSAEVSSVNLDVGHRDRLERDAARSREREAK